MLVLARPFPDFTLPDQSGVNHSLKDYRGTWLVVYFYPKDNTPGCTNEALAFTAYMSEFAKKNATILGVSGDSVKSHEKFAAKHAIPYTLLSDEAHTLLEASGVWQKKKLAGREYMGTVRTTAIVDPQGIVRHLWPKVTVDGHVYEVFNTLLELQKAS